MQREHEEHLKKITEGFLSVATAVYYIPGNVSALYTYCESHNVSGPLRLAVRLFC